MARLSLVRQSEPFQNSRELFLHPITVFVCALVLCGVATVVSPLFALQNPTQAAVSLTVGVGFTSFLWWNRGARCAAAQAALAIAVFAANGKSTADAVAESACSLVSALVGARLASLLSRDPDVESSFLSIAAVPIGGGVTAAFVAATLMSIVRLLDGGSDQDALLNGWTHRFLSVTLGVMLVCPALLGLERWTRTRTWKRAHLATALGIGTSTAAVALVMRGTPQSGGFALAQLCLPVPLVLLAATFCNVGCAAAITLAFGAVLIQGTNAGIGPIVALHPAGPDRLLGIQAYLLIAGGSALALSGAVADWRRTTQRLSEIENRYHDFVSQSADGLWRIDLHQPVDPSLPPAEQVRQIYAHAYVTECNDAAARLHGRPCAQDLVGAPLERLLVHADRRNQEHLLKFVSSSYRLANAESRETNALGEEVSMVNSLVGVLSGGLLVAAWGTQRDITALQRAEHCRARSEARLRAIVDHAPHVAIQRYDAQGRVLEWNATSTRMFGWTSQDAVGKTLDQLILPVDEAARFRQHLEELHRTGQTSEPSEWRVRTRSGGEFWAYSSVFPIPGEHQPEFVCMDVDVTERKLAERERQRLEEKVQQAQKLESLGVMAGGIAHDFNNILVGILGNASIARTQINENTPLAGTIHLIEHAAQRASDLTRQLLAYAGRAAGRHAPLDLSEMVRGMMSMLHSLVPKNVTLRSDLSSLPTGTRGDASQLQQVVMNLLTNAWEAVENKGGRVIIRTGREALTVSDLEGMITSSPARPGVYSWIEVSDDGPGIDSDHVERIFDPFFTTKFAGRGLGLAVVHGIVRSHHGAIKVQTHAGQGSTFRILLPASTEAPALLPGAKCSTGKPDTLQPPAPHPSRRHAGDTDASPASLGLVLVIDDEPMVRDVCARLIRAAGWQAQTAETGQRGLEMLEEQPGSFQAVVLDATMPGLSGCEVLRQIRAKYPDMPVLLSSGFSQESVESNGCAPDAFVPKPFTLERLRDALVAAIAARAVVQ